MKKILAVLMIVGILFGLTACGEMEWPDGKLGRMIPQIEGAKGEVSSESLTYLSISLEGISEGQYLDYIDACREKGFNVDEMGSDDSFIAFTEEGYEIEVYYYSDQNMWIRVTPPIEMTKFEWPTSKIAKLLPIPTSNYGKISWDAEDAFSVDVGNTTREEYTDYIDAARALGFTIDHKTYDDCYYGSNAAGYRVEIRYRGFYTMYIRIAAPDDYEPTTSTTAPSSNNGNNSNSGASTSGIRPEFKEAMDSYEKFFDEYCAFIKKYNSSSDTTSLMSEYMSFMTRYTETMGKMNALGNTTMNAAELQYYTQVVARINQKLLSIA